MPKNPYLVYGKGQSTWAMLKRQREAFIEKYQFKPEHLEKISQTRSEEPSRLHHVKLIRSFIRKPREQTSIAKRLGFYKVGQVIIMKNSLEVNNTLKSISELIQILPVKTQVLPFEEFDELYGHACPMFMADNAVIYIREGTETSFPISLNPIDQGSNTDKPPNLHNEQPINNLIISDSLLVGIEK